MSGGGIKPLPRGGNRAASSGAKPAARPGNATTSNDPTISPEAALGGREIRPHLRKRRERWEIFGDGNTGKTTAWMQTADRLLNEARTRGVEPPTFHMIDCDDTAPDLLNEGGEWEHLYRDPEVDDLRETGNIVVYPAFDWMTFAATVGQVLRNVRDGDWIVVDTVTRAYGYCQEKVAADNGVILSDAQYNSFLSKKGFGGFSGDVWNAVNAAFDGSIGKIVMNPKANCVFVAHMTEVQAEAGRERREVMTMFDQVGFKPQGAPKVPKLVSTVVLLHNVRRIFKDEKGKRSGADTVRIFTICKDRGNLTFGRTYWTMDFYSQLEHVRRTQKAEQQTVKDKKEADKIVDEALDNMDDRDADQTQGIGSTDDDDTEADPEADDDDETNPESDAGE